MTEDAGRVSQEWLTRTSGSFVWSPKVPDVNIWPYRGRVGEIGSRARDRRRERDLLPYEALRLRRLPEAFAAASSSSASASRAAELAALAFPALLRAVGLAF